MLFSFGERRRRTPWRTLQGMCAALIKGSQRRGKRPASYVEAVKWTVKVVHRSERGDNEKYAAHLFFHSR